MKELFGLYLILTNPVAGYEVCAQAAVHCGVRYLQLRMKNTPHEEIVQTAHALRKITRGSQTRLIINDDISIAIECDADGVHLGQNDVSIQDARKQWNIPGKIFGLSTHSMEQAKNAELLHPDYIGIGPVFPTPTKTDTDPALGIAEAGRIAKTTSLTSTVIGGVNEKNLPDLLNAGANNFCVVRAVNEAINPCNAIAQLQKIWKNVF